MDHNVLLQQLGGNRFIAMTGAKDFVAYKSSLAFKLGGGAKNRINRVVIGLADNDTYIMTFERFSIRNMTRTSVVIDRRENVYADQLQAVFTDVTGFATKL